MRHRLKQLKQLRLITGVKMSEEIIKGDNTESFYRNFMTVVFENPYLYKVTKLIFSVNGGEIQKEFLGEENNYFQAEENIIDINFDSTETPKLLSVNIGNLVAYDDLNRQMTLEQSVKFYAKNGVIQNAE